MIVYVSHYRQFAKYLIRLGHKAFLPERPIEEKTYVPYIFSHQEIERLIRSADLQFEHSRKENRESQAQFCIVLRILYGCGMRLTEVCSLKAKDVDLKNNVFTVRNAKNNKERLVPFHESLSEILYAYIMSRNFAADDYIFPSRKKTPHMENWSNDSFIRILKIAGIEKYELPRFGRNICIHCLRHTFAVHSFSKQNSMGKDMNVAAPFLSSYLGHDRIYGTEKYLHLTGENSDEIVEKINSYSTDLFQEADDEKE